MIRIRLLLACFIGLFGSSPALVQEMPTAVAQPAPRPMPAAVLVEDGIRLEFFSPSVIQGGVALMRLSGDAIDSARFSLFNESDKFFMIEGDAWYGILRTHMDTQPRVATVTVEAQRAGETVTLARDIRIDSAGYILQNFELPDDRAYLADKAVETEEFARLDEITAPQTDLALWGKSGFALPLASETTSPFGAYRRLNAGMETRHTGWDQRAAPGSPVRAMAAGRVAFADMLEIRGNYVLIDHGLGIYSGYAHLSELLVNAGDALDAGQIIGMSGNTGRSSGPHLHWEVVARGRWIDGLALIQTWLPSSKEV